MVMDFIFSQRLRFLRKKHRMTQKELADILHYGHTAIVNYESGRNQPSLQDLVKLADFFDVSTDFLLGRSDITNPYISETKILQMLCLLCTHLQKCPHTTHQITAWLQGQKNI